MAIQKGNKWQANAYLNGKRTRPVFNTKEEAEAFERNPSDAVVLPYVGAVFRHGYKFLWEGKRNSEDCQYITDELIRVFGENTPVAHITSAKIQDLVLSLRAVNSGARINRKMSALRMLLRHAYERGAITQLPVFPKAQPESKGRERFLTKAEAEALLSLLPRNHSCFARFLLNTGARVGEALALRWQDVGEGRITFRWDTTKTQQTRTVGLNKAALDTLSLGRELGWSTPWEGINYDQFRRSWDRAKLLAKLEDDADVVPHILRHTFASWLVQSGVSLQVVSKLLGHSTIHMTMRYAKLAPDDLISVTEVITGYDKS